ncbi:MAG: hypothetical protein HQL87_08665 [Magnetococcales bacterium]|nr:hypothetical protein [Magnetococcales bacterium]
MGKDVKNIVEYNLPLLAVVDEIDTIKMTQITVVERVLRFSEHMDTDTEARKNLEEAMHTFIELGKKEDTLLPVADKILSSLSASLSTSPEGRAEVDKIHVLFKKVDAEFDDYGAHVAKLFELIQKGSQAEAREASRILTKEADEVSLAIDQCVKAVKNHIELSALDTAHVEDELLKGLVPVVVFALVCVFFILIPIDLSLKAFNEAAKCNADYLDGLKNNR